MLLFEDRSQFFFLVEVLRQFHCTEQPAQLRRKLRFILLTGNGLQVMLDQLGEAPSVFSGINLGTGNDPSSMERVSLVSIVRIISANIRIKSFESEMVI